MQALVHTIECWVVATAALGFSHFGVSLKDAPRAAPVAVVQRVPVAARATVQPPARREPCPLSRDARQA